MRGSTGAVDPTQRRLHAPRPYHMPRSTSYFSLPSMGQCHVCHPGVRPLIGPSRRRSPHPWTYAQCTWPHEGEEYHLEGVLGVQACWVCWVQGRIPTIQVGPPLQLRQDVNAELLAAHILLGLEDLLLVCVEGYLICVIAPCQCPCRKSPTCSTEPLS